MKLTQALLLSGAVAMVVAGSGLLGGCEADESAPSRPRTQNMLTPDEKAKDNAEHRELEQPKRELPTGGGAEFPGQSNAKPVAGGDSVVTADAGAVRFVPYGSFRAPTDDYRDDQPYANGPVPPLPRNPGSEPAVGSTPVPGTPWSIDHSWGEILAMPTADHRAWPEIGTTYVAADVKHNPVYYWNLQDQLPMKKPGGTFLGGWASNAIEVPWFYANTAILPVLMVLEPPLAQRTTERIGTDPVYLGYLPTGGEVIPSPTPGAIKWVYPFLTQQSRNPNAPVFTQPATTQTEGLPAAAPAGPSPAATAPFGH